MAYPNPEKLNLTNGKEKRTQELRRIKQSGPKYFQFHDYNHGCKEELANI